MKNNRKILITAIIATLLGVGLGYLVFANKTAKAPPAENHQHEKVGEATPAEEEIWTCSMHPQIRQNEPGDCPICGMDLIPLTANTSTDPMVLEMTPEAVKLAQVQTSIVGSGAASAGQSIRLSGKVQSDERLASSQVAHVPGRIEKLFVTFTGEQVGKGQKIATLYSPDLITAQRELLEAMKLQQLNPGLVEAARNKLRYWKVGESAIAQVEESGKIQETFTVFADESGVVTNRRVAVGDYVKQGDPLFDLMSLQKVWVLFDAYEEDISAISVGDPIEFSAAALPNKTFKTKVTFIDPMINAATRVASVRTEVNNTGGLLKPEMLVYGVLQKKAVNNAELTVPKSAVLWTGKRSVVYVKVPETTIPSFQFREVAIGNALGDRYQIESGLEAGEEIVTYGSFAIDAAAQLNNQASMMNRDVLIKEGERVKLLPDYSASTPLAFKQQLTGVAQAYLLLKDALVASNPQQARVLAQDLLKSLAKVDMALVEGAAHLFWMEQLNALQAHASKINEENDLKIQREQFEFFSEALITTIKTFGISKDTFYVQHCPMVNDNSGADWLSKERAVRNPYFGDQMLTCGTVVDTIE